MKSILKCLFSFGSPKKAPRPPKKETSVEEAMDQYTKTAEALDEATEKAMKDIGMEARLRRMALRSKS